MHLEDNEEDVAVDAAGYTGDFRRKNGQYKHIMTSDQFIKLFV